MGVQRKYRAAVVKSHITVEGKSYVTYGIEVQNEEGYAVVHDIAVDRREVRALCRRVRAGRLSPHHLWDVAADFVDR